MLVEAILLSIWAGIAGIDMYNGLTHVHRPIFSGMIVGLILGDVKTGLIAGALIELSFMGLVPIAGSQPPNVVIGGIIGTSFAILTHQDPKIAVGIAVPFAVAMQLLITLIFTAFSFLMHRADKLADKADTRGLANLNYYGLGALFVLYFLVTFLPIYFGAVPAKALVDQIPQFIMSGLLVAGGIMPAIGLAMLLKIMLKREYIAYFIVGFILVTYLKLPIIAVALLGAALAAIDFYMRKNINKDLEEKQVLFNMKNDQEEGI
ncbi:PTS N-acetylgalactosamine transporter subunit IIC [Rickettsiales bacterium LUAb2]